jgi:high affinity sulfate transporter 1
MSQDSPRPWEALLVHLPVSDWLPSYRLAWLRSDILAGLATSTVVVPQAMAYATLAGLPVQSGLYVALVPMLAYVLLGTSRPLSVSTTSALSILTATAVATAADGDSARAVGAASALAVMAGLGLLVAGVLRLGFLADFISLPVLTGFKAGLGLVIVASQLGKVFGIQVSGSGFFGLLWSALGQIRHASLPTLALAVTSLAVLLGLGRWAPRVSGPLIVVVLGIAAVRVAGLDHHGVALVARVPPGLPGFALPDFHHAEALVPAASGIALISFVESISAARAYAATGDRKIDAGQELLALGVANLAAGFFHAYPAGGGMSQTRFNNVSGVRTQLAQVVTAGVVMLFLAALTSLLAGLAEATLAAIVLFAASRLVDVEALLRIRSIRRPAFWQAIVALAGVLVLGALQGLLVAVAISVLVLLHALDQPPIEVLGRERGSGRWRPRDRHPKAAAISGILVVRPAGGLFFANARRVGDRLLALVDAADPLPEVLLVDASLVPDVEMTALEALEQLDTDLRERGVRLWLAGLTWRVERVTGKFGLRSRWGSERFFPTLDDAVAHFLGRV